MPIWLTYSLTPKTPTRAFNETIFNLKGTHCLTSEKRIHLFENGDTDLPQVSTTSVKGGGGPSLFL